MCIQALPPLSGSSRGSDAVERTRTAGKKIFEIKFPGTPITEASLKLTVPLEMKYSMFTNENGVEQSGTLNNGEVLIQYNI